MCDVFDRILFGDDDDDDACLVLVRRRVLVPLCDHGHDRGWGYLRGGEAGGSR